MSHKVVGMKIKDWMRIEAAEIRLDPDDNLVVVTGQNDQGKSSFMTAIEAALRGKKAFPSQPIKGSAKGADIELDLKDTDKANNDIKITRRVTDKSDSIILEVDGKRKKRPQEILDDLFGPISFDPAAFSRKKPKEQMKDLRKLLRIDVVLDKIDTDIEDLESRRLDIGRDLKSKKGALDTIEFTEGLPEEPISLFKLAETLDKAKDHNKTLDDLEKDFEESVDKIQEEKDRVKEIDEEIMKLQEERGETIAEVNTVLGPAMRTAEQAVKEFVPIKIEDIREKMRNAEETNKRITDNKALIELQKDVDEMENNYEKMTGDIKEKKDKKAATIAACKFPVPGLSFTEKGVTVDGIPFEQCSASKKLRVSMAVGMKMSPDLNVLLIRDGVHLDTENMKMVCKMAKANGFQILLERLETDHPTRIVIHDGRIVEKPDVQETAVPMSKTV